MSGFDFWETMENRSSRVELEVDQPIFELKEATHFVYMYVSPLITWAVVAAQR